MNKNIKKIIMLFSLSTSLALASCVKEKNNYNKSNIVSEEKNNKSYNIEDLYIYSVPTYSNTIHYNIVKKIKEENDMISYKYILANKTEKVLKIEKTKNFNCPNEWWLPDYRIETITPMLSHPLIKEMYDENTKLNILKIVNLEKQLNDYINNGINYNENKTYKINRLIMVTAGDNYFLFSLEKALRGFETNENQECIYFYDIVNCQNGLVIVLKNKLDEKGIIFGDGSDTTVDYYEITSLDPEYALDMRDKEKEVFIGGDWKDVTIKGIGKARMCEFSNYLTHEQEKRGYLTQEEVEEIVNSLNKGKTLNKSKR